ncbi:phosphoenolpyruvate--protein phosphotransferase [Pseudidiomarina taiwanensis]|uniref:phosphoenolpyruvate--protein phosphotransferase n=1 Tax=Pseudidiomarina taiwanensis TaxID=337250 RepID=A0A432ZKJ9_9GAMM|nr:phosphoenolpyruvate--protein phosphotransferase [Pseudidiomarina taiwanensis]RUO78469.1 hypothetical protein CWI83_05430 [Pseudidiomarina taiwanensis]
MLRQLQRIVQAVNQAPDFELALQTLVTEVKQALNTDSCTIYLTDFAQQRFRLAATDGLRITQEQPIYMNFGEGMISLAAQREEPLNLAQADQHPRFLQLPGVDETGYQAMLTTPVIHRRKVLGVLVIQQREARAYSADEEAFAVTLAAQLAVVIAHAQAKGVALHPHQQSAFGQTYKGLAAAAGVAIAPAYVMQPLAQLSAVKAKPCDNPEREIRAFRSAVARTRQDLIRLSERMRDEVAAESLAIFEVYHAMLDSESLGQQVEQTIQAGWRAQTALKIVVEQLVQQFEALEDDYIRERASDVRDLGQRILAHLQQRERRATKPPKQCVLVAEEVTVTMLAELPDTEIVAMVSLRGSRNSHAAIMARSMGIAAIVGVAELDLNDIDNQLCVVDGYSGELYLNPPTQVVAEYRQLANEELELRELVEQARGQPAQSKEGEPFSLQLNLGVQVDKSWLQALQSDGVGLFRTEIPFMLRERFPTESEQVELYREVLQQFAEQTVVMRTLDVGGDKPLPYLPLSEENPFLGWRGIRLTLDQPEIFLMQIRAMLKASINTCSLRILLPMVSTVEEVDEALRMIKQAHHEVSEEVAEDPQQHLHYPQVGVMIEVPAVLYQLDVIAEKIDFFSVGSNDLTQYLLAVDRNNERVSALYDAYHPAVIRALAEIAQTCQRLQKPISVCGELAGEPGGALLLAAMGYRNLSMNGYSLDHVRWMLSQLTLAQMQSVLEQVLAARSAPQVHEILALEMEKLGLGGLVRAGA